MSSYFTSFKEWVLVCVSGFRYLCSMRVLDDWIDLCFVVQISVWDNNWIIVPLIVLTLLCSTMMMIVVVVMLINSVARNNADPRCKPKPYHKISGLYLWQIMTKQQTAAVPDRNMLLNNAPSPRCLRCDNPWHQTAAGSLTECSLHGLKVIAVTRAELCSASLLLNATEQAEQRGRVTVTVNKIPLLIDNNQPRLHE